MAFTNPRATFFIIIFTYLKKICRFKMTMEYWTGYFYAFKTWDESAEYFMVILDLHNYLLQVSINDDENVTFEIIWL